MINYTRFQIQSTRNEYYVQKTEWTSDVQQDIPVFNNDPILFISCMEFYFLKKKDLFQSA